MKTLKFIITFITIIISSIALSDNRNMSLKFKDFPASSLLELLAELKELNLILSDKVTGNATIQLKNVSWEQAMNSILTTQGLSMHREESVLFIGTPQDISSYEEKKIQSQNLATEKISIHYAKALNLSNLLQNKSNNLLSNRGSIMMDERTNQLWVRDVPDHLAEIRQFLHSADVPVKQVLIAARIVNIDKDSLEELGLKFGTTTNQGKNNHSSNDGLQIDAPLGITDVGHFTVAIAKWGEDTLLDLELSALERQGQAKIISNPKLMTANREPASIESGEEIPYQEKTSSGATNLTFKKAVLSLKVTPEITPENKISLNLTVNQDKISTLTVNNVPAITTQSIQSQILINNGETIVLGGIYEQTNSDTTERVPFWGSVPIIGHLFTNKSSISKEKELLIFITPTIIAD